MATRHFLATVLAGSLLATAAFADSVTTSSDNGFGRILFTLDPAAHGTANITSGVLTIGFDRKVAIDPALIAHNLAGYVSDGRMDADGKALHFALTQKVRLHTSTSLDRYAVDLAPESFAGVPPDLPKPKAKGPVDIATLATLGVRVGTYSNFTRLVFDWPDAVHYRVFAGVGKITIRFDALAKPDLGAIARMSPPWVKNVGWHVEGDGIVVEFQTDSASGYHDFRDGNHIVVDVLAPRTDAASYNPPGDANVKITPLPGVAKAVRTTEAQVIQETADKLAGKAPAAPAPADKTAAAAAPAADAKTQTQAAASPAATAQHSSDRAALHFPGVKSAAVFIRGATAWIVTDGSAAIDVAALKNQLGDFAASVDQSTGGGFSILRLGLKQTEQISAREQNGALDVTIAPHVSEPSQAIELVRDQDDAAHAELSALMPGAANEVVAADPVAGDSLVIVPAFAGRSEHDMRSYADFNILPTASGLVIAPLSDDLAVHVASARVTVSEPGGLLLSRLSPAVPQSPADLARSGNSPSYLDFAAWTRLGGHNFLSAERRLRANVAAQAASEANAARRRLAQFYLARGFAAEALGEIALMQSADPSLAADAQLQTMRAAADYMMARYKDAHNDLGADSFSGDRHAAFWRGLTEAALENWDAARKDFAIADPVIHLYPATWQAKARIAEARSAIATSALESADRALAKLPDAPGARNAVEAELVRGMLLARENRYSKAAADFAGVEKSGDEQLEAEAIYQDTVAGLAAGAISSDRAIEILDRLRYRWRGDSLELKTLRKLGALLLAKRRWTEALQVLRVASQNFPDNDGGRQAEDDMRTAYVNLFLKGKADKMPPIEALALFYDNIDLTPIGPDGDEMIRRMADRLVSVDLLSSAAKLLDYQVNKRLDGMARAQVATRLAMIQLMDHKPKDALATLRQTQMSGLPEDIDHQRTILEARALAALKQYEQALDMVAVDDQPDSRRLRADIYWESGNWAKAGECIEQLLGDGWQGAAPLDAQARRDVMRAAIAYSLAGDQPGLDRLRTHFQAKMTSSPDASAFAVVTQNIDLQGVAFRDMAGRIASVDTLESFMQDFRKRYAKPGANGPA